MNLIRINTTEAPVPALDIDVFWHAHQLPSSNYIPWCKHHVGRYIDHNDTIENGDLASGLGGTKEAWQQAYNDDYLTPLQESAPRMRLGNVNPTQLTKHHLQASPQPEELSGTSTSAVRAITNTWTSSSANSALNCPIPTRSLLMPNYQQQHHPQPHQTADS
jgi:hypothetical protein